MKALTTIRLIFGYHLRTPSPFLENICTKKCFVIGASICVIFPAVAFLKLTSKNTTERLAARGVLAVGQ